MISLSILWLFLLASAMIFYGVWLFTKSDYCAWETVLYAPVYTVGRLLWRVSFTNEAPSELQGGAILAANHRSSVDPFFVQLAAKRRVHWLVAREYCDHPLFGPFLRLFEVIPTNRNGMDLNATKNAMDLTRQGRIVGMFPEGRINLGQSPLLPIRAGAAMVAVKTEVPIIPIYIQGSPFRRTVWSPLLMPSRVTITFGKPIFASCLPCADTESDSRADTTQIQSQKLIEQWGIQVVEMSGFHGSISLAGRAGQRKRGIHTASDEKQVASV